MADLISALKRLERAGDDASKANVKLLAAASLIGRHVANLCDEVGLAILPRDYTIIWQHTHAAPRLAFSGIPVESSVPLARRLAADLANGWLDEVSYLLETHIQEDMRAALILEEGDKTWQKKYPAGS